MSDRYNENNENNNNKDIEEEVPIFDDRTYEKFYICVKNIAGNPIYLADVAWEYTNNETQTDYSGIAHEQVPEGEYPDFDEGDSLSCYVSKIGYIGQSVDVPKGLHTTDKTPYEVILEKKTNTYYSVIYVKESNNIAVPNATVEILTSNDETAECINDTNIKTYSNGRYTYFGEGEIGDTLYCRVSKNGFRSSNLVEISTFSSIDEAESSSITIEIERSPSADYYYVVKVVNDSNDGVPDINVGIYKDISYTVVYGGNSQNEQVSSNTFNDIFYRVREIIANEIYYNVEDIKRDTLFGDLNISQIHINHIIDTIEDEYQIELVSYGLDQAGEVEEFLDTYISISDLVEFIQQNSDKNIGYKTDANGYIVLSVGKISSQPKSVYAKALSNDGIVWNTSNGTVPPTTSPNEPGLILRITNGGIDVIKKYYNFRVSDEYIGKVIKDVEVTYRRNNEVIKTLRTDDNGLVSYNYDDSRLEVELYKDGYNKSKNIWLGTDTNIYNTPKLSQQNFIKVIYGNECENPGQPAKGIEVSIGYYNENGVYIEKGKYTTYETGYVDCLPSNYFSSSRKYYAIITNYDVDSSNYSALKKVLVGSQLFELPPRKSNDIPGVVPEEISKYIPFYDMTASAIKNNINSGNNVEYTGNDYRIKVLDPDSITTYDIFESKPVKINNNQKSVIGSADIGLKSDVNKLKLKIINRYSGYYNPIFRDVLFYKDYDENSPFSNTEFDYNYKDKYGKFGIINNLWFHKVNDDKNIEILNTLTPYYPLVGKYALDFKDYNIFSSNWDDEYYTKQYDIEHSGPCKNIASMKNGLCMFGSKYLNVPNELEIYGLTLGNDESWNGEWNDDWITNPDGCPGEVMFKEVNDNSVDFYFFLTKRIQRFFYDKLKDEFEKYNATYGIPGVEDDIKEYVAKNVLKLYKLEKVRVFVKRTKKGQHNSKIENDYTTYLEYDKTSTDPDVEYFNNKGYLYYFKQKGFVEVNNVTLSKINRDDFDRKLVYNLRNGSKEEFGFSFILRKI